MSPKLVCVGRFTTLLSLNVPRTLPFPVVLHVECARTELRRRFVGGPVFQRDEPLATFFNGFCQIQRRMLSNGSQRASAQAVCRLTEWHSKITRKPSNILACFGIFKFPDVSFIFQRLKEYMSLRLLLICCIILYKPNLNH